MNDHLADVGLQIYTPPRLCTVTNKAVECILSDVGIGGVKLQLEFSKAAITRIPYVSKTASVPDPHQG